jgi:hypothetical protein
MLKTGKPTIEKQAERMEILVRKEKRKRKNVQEMRKK